MPSGAIVERGAPFHRARRPPEVATPRSRISRPRCGLAISSTKSSPPPRRLAKPENSALISITVPPEYTSRVTEFVADIEALEVEVDRPARVIINERTGTIVMGKEVRVSPVAIMHGNLTVEIQTVMQVSQPAPFWQGQTEVVPQVTTTSGEEKARNLVLKEGATVEQLVQALSSIGSTPRDIIAILQSLRAAGALEADLEVI